MKIRVLRIEKLIGQVGAGKLIGQLFGFCDGGRHAAVLRRTKYLGAEGLHNLDFFFTEALGDDQDDLVAAMHADQGGSRLSE